MISAIQIRSPEEALRTAIYSRLTTDLTESVFGGDVPDGQAYPYVNIDTPLQASWDTKTHGGVDIEITIHAWSQFRGYDQTAALGRKIQESIMGTDFDLSASNFAVAVMRMEQNMTMRDADGFTRHTIQRFRFLIQDTT